MKIRALRVSSVGPFRGGVALENLSGGLDVFIGPNEAGKSSLFRAFNVLFREPHTANNRVTRALQPAGGGSPRVEVDLEIAGRLWRYSKRWFGQRAASLIELDTGRALQGADAEAEAAALLARDVDRTALGTVLWVDQAKGFVLPSAGDASDPLADLVRGEIADAVSGGQARLVAEKVRQRLDILLTAKRRGPRTGSVYHRAVEAAAELRKRKAEAETQAAVAAGRLEELGRLRAEEDRLAAPAEVERRRVRLADAHAALKAAEEAVRRLQEVRQEKETAVALWTSADEKARAFDAKLLEHARLTNELKEAAEQRTDLVREATSAEQALAAVDAERQSAMAILHEAQRQLASAEDQNKRLRARLEADALGVRLAQAREAAAQLANVSQQPAPDLAALKLLRSSVPDREKVAAEIAAQTAQIVFDLLPEAAGRITLDGAAAASGQVVHALEPVTIAIAGIGTIRVTPGRGQSLTDARQRLEAIDSEIAALLARLGVPSLAEAEAALETWRQAEQQRAVLEIQLSSLAPEGLGRLVDSVARLADEAGDIASDVKVIATEPLSGAMRAAEAALADCERRRETIRRDFELIVKRLAVREDQIRRDTEALDRQTCTLPEPEARDSHAAGLRRAAADLRDLRDAAVIAEDAWRRQAPSPEQHERLRKEVAQAELEAAEAARALERVRRELSGLEGALQRDGEMGSVAAVADLEATIVAAEAHVQRFKTEADALLVLEQALADAAKDDEDALGRPVRERLERYAERLIPGLQVVLGDGFAVQALHRFDGQQTVDLLSLGTIEQIGLMTRLAYARLLSDRNRPMPIILDDPLAHTDDLRLRQVFDILEEAACHHQVVVLSCHEAAFAPLASRTAARRLELVTWTPAA